MSISKSVEDLVTLVFVTIGRNEAVKRFILSIRDLYPDLRVIVADQNDSTAEMKQYYHDQGVHVLWLPYDCGLSLARNRAFEQVETPYVLLSDDDFIFTEETDIAPALDILEANKDLGVLGGRIFDIRADGKGVEKRILRRWEKFMLFCEEAHTLITIPIDHLPLQRLEICGRTVFLCDMTSNWGLWRTELFNSGIRWDEEIKINGEHEDFFLTLKAKTNWLVGFLPSLQCDHRQPRNPEYNKLRRRLQGRKTLARKWNITHHLEIGVGLRSYSDYLAFAETPVHYPGLYPDNDAGEKNKILNLKERIATLEKENSEIALKLTGCQRTVYDLHNSYSWKLTAPLRRLASFAVKLSREKK